jgi:uncharacterized protein (TIGR02145 family)
MNLLERVLCNSFMVVLLSCGGQKQQNLHEDKKPDEKKVETVDESPDLPTNMEVKIGNQTWMTRNLDVEKFKNGDSIPQAENDEQWKSAGENKKPIWAYYDYDESNGRKYGKLYNWYAVKDKRGIAPEGWHVPSNTEWEELINFLGGYEIAGKKLKTSKGWAKNGNGTNETGFFGLPSGVFHFNGGSQYKSILNNAQWWTSTQKDDDQVYAPALSSENGKIITWMPRKDYGFSVRCVKN